MKVIAVLDPTTGVLRVLEDGQFDPSALGKVLQRRRVGQIDPAVSDPSKLEVKMLDEQGNQVESLGLFTLKKDAVEAEIEQAKKQLVKPVKLKAVKIGKDASVSTGTSPARCPCCYSPLHVEVIRIRKDALGNQTQVVYRCNCDLPTTS